MRTSTRLQRAISKEDTHVLSSFAYTTSYMDMTEPLIVGEGFDFVSHHIKPGYDKQFNIKPISIGKDMTRYMHSSVIPVHCNMPNIEPQEDKDLYIGICKNHVYEFTDDESFDAFIENFAESHTRKSQHLVFAMGHNIICKHRIMPEDSTLIDANLTILMPMMLAGHSNMSHAKSNPHMSIPYPCILTIGGIDGKVAAIVSLSKMSMDMSQRIVTKPDRNTPQVETYVPLHVDLYFNKTMIDIKSMSFINKEAATSKQKEHLNVGGCIMPSYKFTPRGKIITFAVIDGDIKALEVSNEKDGSAIEVRDSINVNHVVEEMGTIEQDTKVAQHLYKCYEEGSKFKEVREKLIGDMEDLIDLSFELHKPTLSKNKKQGFIKPLLKFTLKFRPIADDKHMADVYYLRKVHAVANIIVKCYAGMMGQISQAKILELREKNTTSLKPGIESYKTIRGH